jgi:hypothetical protein
MGFANLTDPNYKLKTDASGNVVDIVASSGKQAMMLTAQLDSNGVPTGGIMVNEDLFSASAATNAAYFNYDVNGNLIGLETVAGVAVSGAAPAYTWAGKPTAATGNAGSIIRITDIGTSSFGSLWQSNGTNWYPLNGRATILRNFGTLVAPLGTYTGGTAGAITSSGGNLPIQANVLSSGMQLKVAAWFHRRGATSTANLNVRLGTTGTSADSLLFNLQFTATDLKDVRVDTDVFITNSTNLMTDLWLPPQGQGVSGIATKTTNINTASVMYISFDVSAANSADAFDLIGYTVALEY